jgi:hypothetical protein
MSTITRASIEQEIVQMLASSGPDIELVGAKP